MPWRLAHRQRIAAAYGLAAQAMDKDSVLVTHNAREFLRVTGLALEKWNVNLRKFCCLAKTASLAGSCSAV